MSHREEILKYVTNMSTRENLDERSVDRADVIVVGAGLSGLTSALKILQKEPSFVIRILEATNYVGGKIGSSRIGEIGGCWITEDQYHIDYLMSYLHLPLKRYRPVAPHLPRCWDLDSGMTSYLANFELARYLNELECKVYYYKPGRYSLRMKDGSMDSHICSHLWFAKSRSFMRNFVLLIAGVDAHHVSHAEFMSICFTCSNVSHLLDLWFNWSTPLFEISSADLIEALRSKITNVKIDLDCRISEIRQLSDLVELIDAHGHSYKADVVILAIPFNNIQEIAFDPPLPVELRAKTNAATQKMTSFLALYADGYWRSAGYSGSFYQTEPFIVGHEYGAKTYSGFMVHKEGMEHLVQGHVLHALAQYFGGRMLMPLQFEQRTYDLHSMAHAPLTTPSNRLIWSSSASAATCFRGCLGGAVQSGLRAALNAMLVLRPQNVSWQDLAEVQHCENIPSRNYSFPQIWLSSLNIYNVSFYGIFSMGLYAIFRFIYPSSDNTIS